MAALAGLWDVLRGKRVRGWNALCLAAADHPRAYAQWVERIEPLALARLAARGGNAAPAITAIVLARPDQAATARLTAHSLERALGAAVEVVTGNLTPAEAAARCGSNWLLPIRASDRVHPILGTVLAQAIGETAETPELIYWDEDVFHGTDRSAPWIKPDWDPLLMAQADGLTGACLIAADRFQPHPADDWAQACHAVAQARGRVRHLPAILTHRAAPRVAPHIRDETPPPLSISVVIPTRDGVDLLRTCLSGLATTRFPGAHEIIIVDNGSEQPETLALFERLRAEGTARIVAAPGPFNFAALANAGVAASAMDAVCLLNNDIEVTDPAWLSRMAAHAARPDMGAVGARLFYPDGTIQHAGVALGIGGAAGHVEKGVHPQPGQFAPWHDLDRSVSAVTAACLLVSRAKYATVGGMDAATFAVDFNDVDLCLRLGARGWRTVYCAGASLIHHESVSRGAHRTGAAAERFARELAALRERWGTQTAVDPFFSPLFRTQSERCLLAF